MAPSIDTTIPWAYDCNNNELDPELKAAHRVALQDYTDATDIKHDADEGEIKDPLLLRNVLSEDQIDEIFAAVSVPGVWPRGVTKDQADHKRVDDGHKKPAEVDLCDELKSVAHHFAWTNDHVVLYMHNNDWFVEQLPTLWSIIRGAMESRPWMEGGIPVLDEAWIGSEQSTLHVRSIELHHYSAGGGLITPGHRDCGSSLTISVLLSDPAKVSGGDFVTYREGAPVAHKMGRGDAILFNSEDLHNISTIDGGLRQSLVVELYPSNRNGGY
mmetsp:Transcript_8177/g.20106  ORF Transcript_8177/g.20106 Transcript_8177/m.20106 type:complete len:271 (-) Transcript_8177:194-1006(-)|eukprot:CAMPEP_0181120654 /NCGR_PEP_ID=MMETSP1071-20121207/24279_1 /TAXON_ID=35127 /ORGANISM="Thalassiosira sp., Strain NH16" /LENGTH=270 /DNA_ID=CAMNT_0023205339 /DNA_START=82 /DNA_END=897 /DNA_ORIENTATION=-